MNLTLTLRWSSVIPITIEIFLFYQNIYLQEDVKLNVRVCPWFINSSFIKILKICLKFGVISLKVLKMYAECKICNKKRPQQAPYKLAQIGKLLSGCNLTRFSVCL